MARFPSLGSPHCSAPSPGSPSFLRSPLPGCPHGPAPLSPCPLHCSAPSLPGPPHSSAPLSPGVPMARLSSPGSPPLLGPPSGSPPLHECSAPLPPGVPMAWLAPLSRVPPIARPPLPGPPHCSAPSLLGRPHCSAPLPGPPDCSAPLSPGVPTARPLGGPGRRALTAAAGWRPAAAALRLRDRPRERREPAPPPDHIRSLPPPGRRGARPWSPSPAAPSPRWGSPFVPRGPGARRLAGRESGAGAGLGGGCAGHAFARGLLPQSPVCHAVSPADGYCGRFVPLERGQGRVRSPPLRGERAVETFRCPLQGGKTKVRWRNCRPHSKPRTCARRPPWMGTDARGRAQAVSCLGKGASGTGVCS